MDCHSFKNDIGALADGELDADRRVEVEGHVDACPECAKKVARIRNLKVALQRVFEQQHVSTGLSDRVRSRLRTSASPMTQRSAQLPRWVIPIGMAAAVACVWWISVDSGLSPDGTTGPKIAIEAQFAKAARTRHRECIQMGRGHHRADFPLDVISLAEPLSRVVGLPVLVPDWSVLGFVLHSADTCGIDQNPGAHVVYEHVDTGRLTSVFTLRPNDRFHASPSLTIAGRACFLGNREDPVVLGWHTAEATYVIVASETVKAVRMLVESVK